MLTAVLQAAGLRAVAAGNVGLPLLDAVLAPEPYDVLAVELSSFQLHWSSTLVPAASAVLNLADDHTDWHGSFDAYARAKARIWSGPVSVGNADDVVTRSLLAAAPGRRVGFTLQAPRVDELGVVESLLVDRAFADVPGEATALAELSDVSVPGDHNVANALAAAALARAHGVPADAVRDGLRAFRPDPHRNALVAEPAASPGSTTARPPTRTPRRRAWRPTRPWCGSPAACSRAPTSTTWCAPQPAGSAQPCCWAPTGAAGAGSGATRAGGPRRRGVPPRHWRHVRSRRACPRPGAARRHRPARPRRRLDGLLPRLPRARRAVRRGGAGGGAVTVTPERPRVRAGAEPVEPAPAARAPRRCSARSPPTTCCWPPAGCCCSSGW
jgi:hypothetical protein